MTALPYLLFKDNVKVLSPKPEGYLVVINLWAFEWIIIYAKYQSQDNLQATSSAAYCLSDHLRGINLSIHLKSILHVYASQSIPSCHIVSNKISLLSKLFRIHRLSFKIGLLVEWNHAKFHRHMSSSPDWANESASIVHWPSETYVVLSPLVSWKAIIISYIKALRLIKSITSNYGPGDNHVGK